MGDQNLKSEKTVLTNDVYNSLQSLKNRFSPNSLEVSSINNILYNNIYSEKALKEFENLNNSLSISDDIKTYIRSIEQQAKAINETIKQISKNEDELLQSVQEVENELIRRRVPNYKINITLKNNFVSLNDMNEYLNNINEEKIRITEMKNQLGIEKAVGESFGLEGSQLSNQEDIKQVNEDSEKNVKTLNNPSNDQLIKIIKDYKTKRNNNENFSVVVTKSTNTDSMIIELSHHGVVDESLPKMVIEYSNLTEKKYEPLFIVMHEYVEGTTEQSTTTDDRNYYNVASNKDIFELRNFDQEEIKNASKYIKDTQTKNADNEAHDELTDEKNRQNKQSKAKVRVRVANQNNQTNYTANATPGGLLISILVFLLIAAFALTIYIIMYM